MVSWGPGHIQDPEMLSVEDVEDGSVCGTQPMHACHWLLDSCHWRGENSSTPFNFSMLRGHRDDNYLLAP